MQLYIYVQREERLSETKERPSSLRACPDGENPTCVHVQGGRGGSFSPSLSSFPPVTCLKPPQPLQHRPPCRGPLASRVQECVRPANAVTNLPLRLALSSSLEKLMEC